MKNLIYSNRSKATKETGLSYLGNVNQSAKMIKNSLYNEMTYIIYLAPADMSGYEVCPMRTAECTALCLNTSGRVKLDIKNKIIGARIKKTKLFFENRQYFMRWMIDEISFYRNKAKKLKMDFSVRLNGTSDISPIAFNLNGKNILQIFPDVQFYDYTKVLNRYKLLYKYKNYDLTYSYSGYNDREAHQVISSGGRVAIVFSGDIPNEYKGVTVINGDDFDMRYKNPGGVFIGLKYKKVKGNPDIKKSKFVVND